MKHPDSISPPKAAVRIRYMSDLHLEFTNYQPDTLPSAGEDLVILAGDIGTGTGGIDWARKAFPDTPVLYLLGNHEFYGYDWNDLIREARSACEGTNVVLLENDVYHYKGIRFLGASLWTNFLLQGHGQREVAMEASQNFINDYRHIRNGGRALCARDTIVRHEESMEWLRVALTTSNEPTVVITHHAPCVSARHPGFPLDELSNVFYSDLPKKLFEPEQVWIFGHTHHSMTGTHEGTCLHSNQRGYPSEKAGAFSWDKILEVFPAERGFTGLDSTRMR